MQLDVALDAAEAQALTEYGVFDLVDGACGFDLAILHANRVVEHFAAMPMRGDVVELIDGRRQHCAAVAQEVFRVIRPAAEKADANGCSGDDHVSVDVQALIGTLESIHSRHAAATA